MIVHKDKELCKQILVCGRTWKKLLRIIPSFMPKVLIRIFILERSIHYIPLFSFFLRETTMQAKTVHEVGETISPRPLEVKELTAYYVSRPNIDELLEKLRYKINENPKVKITFAGYKGCGKSTELNKLTKKIKQDGFEVINFSISEELDPISFNYIELFIVMMEKLFEFAENEEIQLSENYLALVSNWLSSEEIEEVREKHLGRATEIGGGVEVNLFAKFFSKFKLAARDSKSMKETIKKKIEPKVSELIELCNDFFQELRLKKKKILFIIEDVDKIPLSQAEHLFIDYVSQLQRLKVASIYTLPISLVYHSKFNLVRGAFDIHEELPMIEVRKKNGARNLEGIDLMKAILEKRMDLALFDSRELLEKFIFCSGGCLRDLFVMVNGAAVLAVIRKSDKIQQDHFDRAYYSLKRILVALAKSETKKVDNTDEVLVLRTNRCILGYNSEGWEDVHPIVKEILKERALLS